MCDVCGAYLSVLDSDRRLADHFGGKVCTFLLNLLVYGIQLLGVFYGVLTGCRGYLWWTGDEKMKRWDRDDRNESRGRL